MKVKMTVATRFAGSKYEAGATYEADPAVAERWTKAGIAKNADEPAGTGGETAAPQSGTGGGKSSGGKAGKE
jgi:hypothetical protein